MSLTEDIAKEIKELEFSRKVLRKFGLMVGGVFLVVGLLFMFTGGRSLLSVILTGTGAILMVVGTILPDHLKYIYKYWMIGAFLLGWFVSRLLLTVLFFIVVTPLGIIARIVGKKFLHLKFRDEVNTYWIMKDEQKKINYEKLY